MNVLRIKTSIFYNYFLFFLPFTQALTIHLFFPLKISEILFFLIILFLFQLKVDRSYLKFMKITEAIGIFLFVTTVSFLVNIMWSYNYLPKSFPFRISRVGDSFFRLIYIYVNITVFFTSIYFISKGSNKCIDFWLKGALFATVYGWYLFISSALKLPYLKLFGMEENPQTLMGIVRSGTFKEGNYFGLFLLLSASLAFYRQRYKLGWFFIISILTTFSTVSIISSGVLLLVYYSSYWFRKKYIKTFILIFPIFIVLSIAFIRSNYYEEYVYKKIFAPVSILTPENLSKIDRYITADIAYHVGLNNPVLGVGPFNYGLHYDHYNRSDEIINNHSEWSRNFFNRPNLRAIPNNVYMEVWAEYGILGFIFFVIFLLQTFYISVKLKNKALIGGLLAMYLSFNAFPSFIMLFLWVYLALPYALLYRKRFCVERN